MLVIFDSQHKDLTVRQDVGQKLKPEQVKIACCAQIVEKESPDKKLNKWDPKRWELEELSHGVDLK